MEAIEATVIDPMHLELKKPLALRSGARVSVVVSEDGEETDTATLETTGAPGPVDHRQREQAWRQTHGDILRGYAGQWLVLEGEEVIAHGDDPALVPCQS
jgi:hypothetical protein